MTASNFDPKLYFRLGLFSLLMTEFRKDCITSLICVVGSKSNFSCLIEKKNAVFSLFTVKMKIIPTNKKESVDRWRIPQHNTHESYVCTPKWDLKLLYYYIFLLLPKREKKKNNEVAAWTGVTLQSVSRIQPSHVGILSKLNKNVICLGPVDKRAGS